MLWLAFKTLFHEKGRLFITLMGITFATILEESGKAVTIVSHDSKAEDLAHRVVFLEDGRLKT